MKQVDWDKLRVFSKIAEMGSLSKASEILHISQSALSRQLSILEKEIGCLLFKRIPRGLALTPGGEILYKTAQDIILRLATAEMMLLEDKDSSRGLIRIDVTHVLGTFWLPRQLLEFSSRYPDIYFKLAFTEEPTDFSLKKVDISISLFPASDQTLVSSHPIESPTGIYASESYLKTHGFPKKISDLDAHRLIILQDSEAVSPFLSYLHWLLEVGRPPDNPRSFSLSFNNFQGLYYATKNNAGIAQLPKFCVRPEDNLVELFVDIPKPLVSRYVTCPKQALSLKRVFVFRNFILEKLVSFFEKI